MSNKSPRKTSFSRKSLLVLVVMVSAILGSSLNHLQVFANEGDPRRTTTIVVSYTQYEWWMSRWSDNEHLCHIYTNHEGFPTASEVYIYCGATIYEEWAETTTCPEAVDGDTTEDCLGVYLHLVGSTPREKEVTVELPIPEARISLEGCSSLETANLCAELPFLRITAQDPLPNEHITQIQGTLNDIPFMCQRQTCEVPLRVTSTQGIRLEFWADSSYGDSSKHYHGRVRVVDSGVSDNSKSSGWYVDLVSEGGDNVQNDTCAQAWDVFPPIGAPPQWLANPMQPELLATDTPLAYLAGKLITNNVVDASECDYQGLLSNGYASPCGLEKARPEVLHWQNLFDPRIIEASQESGIPSQTLKKLFALESQFWPGVLRKEQEDGYDEYGLGQLTELGADTALLWNQDFFIQFCPLVLNDTVCQKGYTNMEEENQVLLRGALLAAINAECPNCSQGIDMENVDTSIKYFAHTLTGNCMQVREIVSPGMGEASNETITYEDLWRFTLVNYHAGSGCLQEAVEQVLATHKPIDWENVSQKLETVCPSAVDYVEEFTK